MNRNGKPIGAYRNALAYERQPYTEAFASRDESLLGYMRIAPTEQEEAMDAIVKADFNSAEWNRCMAILRGES